MKITTFIIFAVILQVSAAGFAQKVTLSSNNSRLTEVFNEIRNQTGYDFLFTSETLKDAKRVSIKVENAELKDVLNQLFTNQPLEYIINKKAVIVSKKEAPSFLERVVDAFTPPVDVRGTVVDEKGMPLPGANVKVKGFKQAAVTDNEGRFYLPGVDDKAVLIVSFVGYKDMEIGVKASLSVALELKAAELNEVVVAYGKTTQQALTGSVTVVKGEQIQNLPNRSFDKSLQGLVPGLLVTSGSGQPGSPTGNFILRGIATGADLNATMSARNPLIVVDGVPVSQEPAAVQGTTNRITNPLAQLNPSDIETISVLKDAAAIALYGSQASNGVILVTTKKGKPGKTQFNFRHQTDISSALEGKIEMLNQQEYLELLFEAYKNSNPASTNADILADLRSKFPIIVNAPGDTSFYPQADWAGALLNKNAVTVANEISMSGGNDNSNFYLNLEYTKQDGVAKNTGYDRKSMRFNYGNQPVAWFKLGLNTAMSYNVQKYTNSGFNGFLNTIAISPLNPIRDIDGNYIYRYPWGLGQSGGVIPLGNPIVQAELDINSSAAYRGLGRLSAELKITPELSVTSNIGIDFMSNEAQEKSHPLVSSINGGFIMEQLLRTTGIISTNLLQYQKKWSELHSLNILAGQEIRTDLGKSTFVQKTDLSTNPGLDDLSGGNVINQAIGNTSRQNLASYFGQFNYGFKDRYYLSGSVRSDGSSRFGRNNRYGTYWSVGAGWVLSAEPFMNDIENWLSYFKLRGSMGPQGNSTGISDLLRFDLLHLGRFLDGITVFRTESNPANPTLQWESTFTWDAGLEARLFKDRINFTVDIYNRNTKKLIAYNINAPLATGSSKLTGNIGDVKNHGIELSASSGIIKNKNFNWNISVNWSRNKNTLTKAFSPRADVAGTNLANVVGEEYNSFYLIEWAGVNPENGRPMWVDSLSKPNENFSAAKQKIVGKAQPDGFGGLNNALSYKSVSFSFGLYYQYGSKVYLEPKLQNDGNGSDFGGPYLNQTRNALNRWQKPGDVASNPRRLLNGQAIIGTGTQTDLGSKASTRYLFNGDFIRLANVSLSYNLPKQLIKRLQLNSVRVFIHGFNLATWTKYSGDDPENVGPTGFGSPLYPQAKSYSLGLNVNF